MNPTDIQTYKELERSGSAKGQPAKSAGRDGGGKMPERSRCCKNMKMRNEPIFEMQQSPDFTDVKW